MLIKHCVARFFETQLVSLYPALRVLVDICVILEYHIPIEYFPSVASEPLRGEWQVSLGGYYVAKPLADTRQKYPTNPFNPNHKTNKGALNTSNQVQLNQQSETRKLIVSVSVYDALKHLARRLRKSTPPAAMLEQYFRKHGILVAGLIPEEPEQSVVKTLHVPTWLFHGLQEVQAVLNMEDWNFTLMDIVSANLLMYGLTDETGELIVRERDKGFVAPQHGHTVFWYNPKIDDVEWVQI